MPSSCFVPGCKGNYNGSVKVGSYRIPRDELIRKKWVEVLHRKESDISKYSRDMPFKCVVPQCKSNYKPPYVSCYRFPRDIEKQKIWLKCIHYENYKITESSKVCEIHFQNSDFETEVSAYDPKTDRTITCSLARKRLRKGVVPSLFLPTSDLVPPKRNLTHQNKKQPKGLPVKSGHLKESVKTASLTVRKKEEKSENMVKRKRKSAVTETSNKKVGSTSALNGTQSSNGVTSDKSTEAKSKRSDRPICTNPEAFAFLNVEIKREPLSDDEKQNNPFRNNSEEHISENMQITNVRSVSSERSYTVSPDEVNVARKPDENLDSDFYSKPLSMEQRDKAFGSFVACELSDLHENPTLYMKTKQSILKILTEAHFEQMSSGKDS